MIEKSLTEQTAATSRRRTRRQLLAGGITAAGVVVAEALGRATPAAAANGDPIVMGQTNQATSGTVINQTGTDTTFSATSSGNAIAMEGDAAAGIGVLGTTQSGLGGVYGGTPSAMDHAVGVFGEITTIVPGAYSAAVRGKNDGTGSDGIGVYGSHDGDGWGMYGTTQGGTGVFGKATTGTGVEGSGTTGVFGVTEDSKGVAVWALNPTGGSALRVDGVAEFSRSGVITVPAGRSRVTHPLPLTSASLVLATIQGNVTDLYVRGVTIAAGANGSFTIHLSEAAKSKTKVAWLAVN